MSKIFRLVIVILIGINSSLNYAQTIEERIDFLDKVDKSVLEDSIGAITWSIYVKPPETAKKYSDLLLKKTKEISVKANLIAKSFSLNYDKTNYIARLDSIYNTAKENDLTGIMAGVLVTKSDYYKQNEKYDSAMVAILEAQNIYKDMSSTDGYVASRQMIGDLYFTAGLYKDAEEIYKEIEEIKGETGQWENWRRRVIRNNLALIDIKKGKYDSAIERFNISLGEAKNGKSGIVDTIAIVYLNSQLAEVNYLKKEYEKASEYFHFGINNALKLKQYEFAANLYLTKSKICVKTEKPDSALIYAKLSENLIGKEYNSLKFTAELTLHISNIYEKIGKIKEAFEYSSKGVALRDSLLQKRNKWSYLQILAKNNSEKLENKLQFEQEINRILITGGIISAFFFAFIIWLNIKLRKSNLKLVSKNLELEKSKITAHVEKISDEIKQDKKEIDENYFDLIKNLDELMKRDKLFLQKDITIQKTAEILKTNRTYLSNAINQVLQVNFNSYINKLRMEEVIRLIQSGYFDNKKIEVISDYCGFRSRTAFNNAFLAYTGVTPSFFIKNAKIAAEKTEDNL